MRADGRIRGGRRSTIVQFLQLLLAGVAPGCVYALVALGFVLIYKATETVNFAQGVLARPRAYYMGIPVRPGEEANGTARRRLHFGRSFREGG